MKTLLFCGLALSLTAYATSSGSESQGSGYAPNDGTAKPGNPGTFTTPKAGMGNAAPAGTGTGTSSNPVVGSDVGTNIPSGNADPNVEANENLERSNTTPTPIPDDTTLQGSTQTGPYKTGKNKQSQEATDEELDYRANPNVDHTDENASENQ